MPDTITFNGYGKNRQYFEKDVEEIKAVVAALDEAQRLRSPDRFMALLAPEAVWVTAFGRRLTGWHEIDTFTRRVLTPALGDRFARYGIERITFPAVDVAIVNARQIPLTDDGSPEADEPEGRPLYILAKRDGRWMIVAGQNTKYQPDSLASQQSEMENRLEPGERDS